MSELRDITRLFLGACLPYPDLPRRVRIRHRAGRLITFGKWPGEDAKGKDAAQLALARLLYLQKCIRRAVRDRRLEEATLLARSAIDVLIVGLYCLHSDTAVSALAAADRGAARRILGYLSLDDLVSEEAIRDAAQALGETGRDPKLAA
jgi:hypothetical protein